MLALVLIATTSLAIGGLLGWLLARKLKGDEPAAARRTGSDSIDGEIESEIERQSVALARRCGRLELTPLFASKLRLAYLLRDAPRERGELS